jgi:hypothetical protein
VGSFLKPLLKKVIPLVGSRMLCGVIAQYSMHSSSIFLLRPLRAALHYGGEGTGQEF